MSTILVTGGTGYIGSHTCVELLNEGHDVIILDNFSNSSRAVANRIKQITQKDLKLYECDLRDTQKVEKIFSENKIDAVIHFAGLKSVAESVALPILYYDNNVYSSINLCEIMQKFGVKNIIFSSSATVYGASAAVPYDESMPTGNISNPYGKTKLIIEQLLFDIYHSDPSWNIMLLRYFNPIGAHKSGLIGESPRGVPNNLMPYISKVAAGKLDKLTIFGKNYATPDGTCIRDFIHVMDVAKGHIYALNAMASHKGINIYNLGTSVGTSVLDLVKTFEKVTNQKINYTFGEPRAGDLPVVYANADKIFRELGFKAKYSIEEMCADTWHWQSMNPDGY